MPRPHPREFRRRAVELARLDEKPISQIAKDLGISESCLRNWLHQADVDDGRRDGISSGDQAELSGCGVSYASRRWKSNPQAGRGVLRPGERPPKMI